MAKGSFMSGVWRWTKRIGLGLLGLFVALVIVGTIWEALTVHSARQHFKPRGQVVDIGGGRHMHIDCRGTGAPTVLLEAGLDTNGTLAWSAVQDQIASFTRVCSYDRAGVQWSDEKSTVHDGEGVAHDLHALLTAAHEQGPFVMAGHSLGGPYVMTYTRFYPQDVVGVVFVDASHPDQLKRFKAAGLPGGDGKLPLPIRLVAKTSWSGLVRVLMAALAGDPKDGPQMPPAAAAEAAAFGPPSFPAAMKEGNELGATLDEAGKLRTLGDRPLVVLTATEALPAKALKMAGIKPDQYAKIQVIWKVLQTDEASWSTHSRRQEVPDSTHYIQFGRPDIVIAAVKEVVGDVRAAKTPVKGK